MRRYLLAVPLVASLAVVALLAFTATAFAQGVAVSHDSSILDIARPIYDAFNDGHYAYAAAILVVILVAATKNYLGDRVKWLHSDAGGSAMALVAASASALAAGLAAPGAVVTWALVKSALLVGVGAAGGFAMLKNLLVEPLLMPLEARLPAFAKPAFDLLRWFFDHGKQAPVNAAPAPSVTDAPAPAAQPKDSK